MMITFIIAALGAFCIYYILRPKPRLKAGVYKVPGRWYCLKRAVFSIMYHHRSARRPKMGGFTDFQQGIHTSETDVKGYGQGMNYEEMEKPQTLSSGEFAIDCAYFGGTDSCGAKFACRLARRKRRRAEVWLFLEIPGIGCLQFPRHPDTDAHFTDGESFSAGGLHFEVLEPMKRWKISFSGKLRHGLCNSIDDKQGLLKDARFSFIWSAFSQPFNFDTDMASSVLGDSIAREEWSHDFFHRLKANHQSHYEQWGEIRGRLSLEGHEDRLLYLQCVRDHSFGERDWRSFHRYIIHFIYLETGMTIQVGIFSQPSLMSHVKLGYLSYANGDIVSVTDIDLCLWDVGEKSQHPPGTWEFSFTADRQKYVVKATGGITPVWYMHEDRGGKVMEVFTTFQVNSHSGRGIAEYFYRNYDGPSFEPPTTCPIVRNPLTDIEDRNQWEITMAFTDEACKSSALVGGKGAQLAQLTALQTEVKAAVPPGFCLTFFSFGLQLEKNGSIEKAIEGIVSACTNDLESLQSACSTTVELITGTRVYPDITQKVIKSLQETLGTDYERTHVAVRSSAAGEDGTEASSAGQMETILGVVGFSKILEAVQRCWASVYTQQAVEYRRQHGQPIRVLVGVVIQRMVNAYAAGVMFTADPISGNNCRIAINANFGLGESVVSGKSDPDTIIVERDPTVYYCNNGEDPPLMAGLSISSKRVGGKKTKMVETGDGGIEEIPVPEGHKTVCLREDTIFRLATLGVHLEQHFGSPRDIEWAVVENHIYLLQCRPITVMETETEEDLLHEFDSPMTCEHQWMTTANISEMMPGAVTPLTLSTFMISIEYSLQVLNYYLGARHNATHLPKSLPAHCNHLFIALMEISTIFMSTLMVRKDIMEISLLGNLLPEFSVEEIKDYYGRTESSFKRFLNLLSMMRLWSKASALTAEWEKKIPNYVVGPECNTAVDLYNCIHKQLVDYQTVWVWTLINSGRSGNWANILMSIIGGDASVWSSDHYGDIAMLLSQCEGVFSAEVPHAIEAIAREIAHSSQSLVEDFMSTPDTECMALLSNQPELKRKVYLFLDRHGHRCLRESELREKSWKSAPEKFISVLKIMLETKSYDKPQRMGIPSVPELLKQMKTKVPFIKKLALRFLLPKAWEAVGAREWGKSISVQMSEIFKLAYGRLANIMHKEGRLPDADLLYFLTHREIGTLLSTRSAKLIIKAQKRRKVLAVQAEQRFEKMNKSRPVPIKKEEVIPVLDKRETLKGMPVSQGVVAGPAQVVHSLAQASVIQAGDILVVNSTDVGWSPYFPLIGGLVTELGGLISHGAVVAREYGIPCVVNVRNATDILQTGERLQLDGRLGLVKRLDFETSEQHVC